MYTVVCTVVCTVAIKEVDNPGLVDRVHGKYIIRYVDSGRVPSLVDVSHSLLALHSTLLFFLFSYLASAPLLPPYSPSTFTSFTFFPLTLTF
jgi:hypothetical protein